MATVTMANQGGIRKLPIKPALTAILKTAAERTGIDEVVVTSDGQVARSAGGIVGRTRTGSTRHDNGNAADLFLKKDGRILSHANDNDLPIISRFVTECSRLGATGIGAGGRPGSGSYMGSQKIHVGFGAKATWGGDKARSADAPAWLKAAVAAAKNAAPPTTPPPDNTKPPKFLARTLRKGDNGPDVAVLQDALNKALGLALKEDGDFGERTEAALMDWQAKNGLTRDGIFGPQSRAKLGI